MNQGQLADFLSQLDIDASSLNLLFGRSQHSVYGLTTPKAGAIETWRRLRDLSETTGHWPVLGWGIGWDASFPGETVAYFPGGEPPDEVVAASTQIDPIAWLRQWSRDHPELLGREQLGDEQPQTEFWIAEATGIDEGESEDDETAMRVPLALIPTVHGWEVPAHLTFDNPDPPPAVHVALAQRWSDLYGAEIVVMQLNTLEMRVTQPPKTIEAARALVEEQALYRQVVLPRKMQAVESLARRLLRSTVWSFWWD